MECSRRFSAFWRRAARSGPQSSALQWVPISLRMCAPSFQTMQTRSWRPPSHRIPHWPAPCECHPGMRRRPLPGLVPRKYFPPPSGLCEEGCRDSASLLSAFVLRAAKKSPEGSSFMILSCRVLWEFPRIGACFAVPDFNTAFILLLPELQPVQLSLSIASRSAAACSWLFTRIVRMPKYSAIGRFR